MRRALAPLLLMALTSCETQPETWARARTIERLDQAVGGPKASARPGDFVIENQHLRVAILNSVRPDGSPRYSLGPALFGGTLADADLQRRDPRFTSGRGVDQLAEVFATVSMNIAEPTEDGQVRIVADGSDGGDAIIRVEAPATPFLSLLSALWAITRVPDMRMVTDYVVSPDAPWLLMRTAVRVGPSSNASDFGGVYPAAAPATPEDGETFPIMDDAVVNGLVMGDFFLTGGSVSVFAPGMGFDEDGLVARAGDEGRNSFAEPFRFDWLAGVGDGVSYGIMPVQGQSWIPLFTSSQTAVIGASVDGTEDGPDRFRDGDTFSYERLFFVGHGDVGSIFDQVLVFRDTPRGTVRGRVREQTTDRALSGVDVFVYEPGATYPINQWRTDVALDDTLADGSFAGFLPVGTWEILVHQDGRPDAERLTVTVDAGAVVDLELIAPRPGTVSFTLRDETGQAVPGKVTFLRTDGPARTRPELGDAFIAGDPEAVVFPMYGEGVLDLPDGEYVAVASRGLEYEIDTSAPFRVDADRSHHLDLVVERSVDTEGWISADFHVHAEPSHDSGVSLVDRVRSMVCEGVEFFSSTDHDVITDYAPTIEQLGLESWVQSAVGVETTTVELGHFLGFPLEADWAAEAGGALDWTGRTPTEMITSVREQGRAVGLEPMVFVGHPRAGILGYFDQYGVSAYGGTPGQGGVPGTPLVQTPTLALTNPLLNRANVDLTVDAMELMATKEMFRIRTPTQPELDRAVTGDVTMGEILARTEDEQRGLSDGTFTLGYGHRGQVDDWFTLLNLGFKLTALANSDTHDMTTTEAGCPRNYVLAGTDDPAFLDDQEIADAVRAHRVIATHGPFVQLWLDGATIGDEITPDTDTLTVSVEVRAPSWMDVDAVELYENGTLIQRFEVTGDDPYRFTGSVDVTPARDSWYVAIAVGDGSLAPVVTPVERPIIDLQAVVVEALGGVEAVSTFLEPAVPIPQTFPITPYAVTNPIWVDLDGDGFDAPGLPDWLEAPRPAE